MAHVQHLLNEEATKTVIQAIVLSKIDYCNIIYQGAPAYAIEKLQQIHNMGCRIVKRSGKHDHITPQLTDLHWLKINECIIYNCVLMYKCIKGMAPEYLSEVIIKDHGHSLRSTTLNNLQTIRCNTALEHNSAFSSTGPRLWNMLPYDIKCSNDFEMFKTKFQTFLFKVSYDLHW